MSEKKICEQCREEKPLGDFYQRKNKTDNRMKICVACYKLNQETRQANAARMMEEWKARQAETAAAEEARRLAHEQEKQRRQARALELCLQMNRLCPRCHQVRTDGTLWISHNGEEHLFFRRYCQSCTDATPHKIYKLTCPILEIIRYVGITCQPLNKRLSGHMRNDSGTDVKNEWIDMLKSQGLSPQIDQIEAATNEKEAAQLEQEWIRRYIKLGYPLVNGEALNLQYVLDVQSERVVPDREFSIQEMLLERGGWEYHLSAASFRRECHRKRRYTIDRWRNRFHHMYIISTHRALSSSMELFSQYDRYISEWDAPQEQKERQALLSSITIAFFDWNNGLSSVGLRPKLTKEMQEDIRYLLSKSVPILCTKTEENYKTEEGMITGMTPQNTPHFHPFSYTVDPARAIVPYQARP